jgi:hypothetical protein
MCASYRFLPQPKKGLALLTSELHTCHRVLSAISKTLLCDFSVSPKRGQTSKHLSKSEIQQHLCSTLQYIHLSQIAINARLCVVKPRVLSGSLSHTLFSSQVRVRDKKSPLLKSQSINVAITFDDYAGSDTFEAFSLKNRNT